MMNRFQAQSHLLGPGNDENAFLVRRSEKDNVGYVLSGKARRRGRGEGTGTAVHNNSLLRDGRGREQPAAERRVTS